ncbi:RHS repeat protein [Pseudomonas sp. FSL R10-0765]|uniref:RHS repeat protein n=1 Tax=Pseudomonas sp. FSL R10-0765 TaxID=2662195 RepID=UPI0015B621FF|nr:RHS repeat protein [Pseudomonas sp. FSL R10-0765]
MDYVPYLADYRLNTVKDESDITLLLFTSDGITVSMQAYPYSSEAGGALAVYTLFHNQSQSTTALTLPTEDGARWLFTYADKLGFNCICRVETPTGGLEVIEYGDGGHKHPDPTASNLPRATLHSADPGCGQPIVTTEYRYDLPNQATQNNFLGFGASGLNWDPTGIDNLYQVINYDYSTVERLLNGEDEVRRVQRTFNSFHLLVKEETYQNESVMRVTTTYHALADTIFVSQPLNFQLPASVETRWEKKGSSRSEIVKTTYDKYGNLIEEIGADGVTKRSTYYLAEGGDGCPKDPEGFVRSVKDTTVIPASGASDVAQQLTTAYRYTSFGALNAARADWLAVESESLFEVNNKVEKLLHKVTYNYNNDVTQPLVFGRIKQQALERPSLDEDTYKFLTDYDYNLSPARYSRAAETVLQTIETITNFDGTTKKITSETSTVHGQPLLVEDDNDVKIAYVYDALQRVIQETVAPDLTNYIAHRYYTYELSMRWGVAAKQIATNVKGVKTTTLLDGFNRVVGETRQNADAVNRARADDFRETYRAQYDVFGNLIAETEIDWLDESEPLELTTSFLFDDWGQQQTEVRPDGVKVHEETNPIGSSQWNGPIITTWTEVPGSTIKYLLSVSKLNAFEKPVMIERYDGSGDVFSSRHEYFYDGLGRMVREVDGRKCETRYEYDAFGRTIKTTLPDKAKVVREYAAHSAEDLPTLISVEGQVLGTQGFDGLGRMTSSTTGGREKVFDFRAGELQPWKVTTARHHEIEYTYAPQLGEEPTLRKVSGSANSAKYEYDPQNARLKSCTDQDQTLEREYFSTGEIRTEKVSQVQGEPLTMTYDYSLRGRIRSYKDVLGQTQTYDYDSLGRLDKTTLGNIRSTFEYNSLGLMASITTEDGPLGDLGNPQVIIKLDYDKQGREVARIFYLNGVEQTLVQDYDEVDNLSSRTLKEGDVIIRQETYVYDVRSRLVSYECTGTQPPEDPHGRSINSQYFTFDALDNITLVDTIYTDGTYLMAEYAFDNTDPVQLSSLTYTFNGGVPQTTLFTYDEEGNMTSDELGRVLEYDPLNRLSSVSLISS